MTSSKDLIGLHGAEPGSLTYSPTRLYTTGERWFPRGKQGISIHLYWDILGYSTWQCLRALPKEFS